MLEVLKELNPELIASDLVSEVLYVSDCYNDLFEDYIASNEIIEETGSVETDGQWWGMGA